MRQRGVTLVELMIGVALAAILLGMGVPAFSLWIQTTQNRTAAESVLNGLQMARNEAVKRNAVVRFNLPDTTGLATWSVGCVNVTTDCPATIQKRSASEGSVNARLGVSTADIPVPTPSGHFSTPISAGTGLDAGISFDSLGRPLDANKGDDITRIDITSAAASDAHRYVVTIGAGGDIRMCDPSLSFASNPQGCS